MGNPIVHVEINAKDSKKLQTFYKDLFGWHIDTNNPMGYGMIDTHTGKGVGGGIGPARDGRPFLTFYVETEDLTGQLAKAEKLGAKKLMEPTAVGPVTLALFSDPEGNVIGLSKGM